ncbi:MAG: NAD-dependent epimerase/dehydratase family protein [Deltaproteobacteria bacterium]
MNILVTGGLGVNGVWVIRQLVSEGHRPVVYDNRYDTLGLEDIVDKMDIVVGDISDIASIIRVLKEYGIKRIIHVASAMPDAAKANPFIGFKVNAFGTLNILEAARIMKIERVVFTSSKAAFAPAIGEYGYPTYKPLDENYLSWPAPGFTVYGGAKIASELMGIAYSQTYGMEFVALRFAAIYGPGKSARHQSTGIHSQMIENAMAGKPTTIPRGGDARDDMLYVKDCANSIVLACFAKNLKHYLFTIGTGKGYTLNDLADSIKKVYPEAVFQIGPGEDYKAVPGMCAVMDISRAREELGYTPKFYLEKGVKDCIEVMKGLSKKKSK